MYECLYIVSKKFYAYKVSNDRCTNVKYERSV